MQFRACLRATAGMAAAIGLLGAAPAAMAQPDDVDTAAFQRAVTVNGILAHERALQAVANLNGGTRASGTPGYEASLNYVARRLERLGYRVSRQEFTFPFFRDLGAPELAQVSPTAKA